MIPLKKPFLIRKENDTFSSKDLVLAEALIEEKKEEIIKKWKEVFDK